ncbi:hypothetical protein Bca4012_089073 [Brassica carinata]|uniref:(rape) hypothetical protein n=1 Tax=Brassica napus TaxID=3708 RepID=A0A816U5J3_BRANA|nr:unnamed protein product [Brassica napus]CAF2109615.1 unnamed protein product [Brassica napus]
MLHCQISYAILVDSLLIILTDSLQEYNRKSNDDPKVSIQSYGNEIDVWSEGIILIILLCGVPLFWAANILLIVSSI